jgi:2-methylisocitrate lyase-like PEP mutase family enzyme
MAFLEAPQTSAEVEAIPQLIKGPCLLNVVSGGKTPILDLAQAERLGFRLAILPGLLFQTVVSTFRSVLSDVKAQQCHPKLNVGVREAFRAVGSDDWDKLRERFKPSSDR